MPYRRAVPACGGRRGGDGLVEVPVFADTNSPEIPCLIYQESGPSFHLNLLYEISRLDESVDVCGCLR